jgi:exosortase
MDKEANGVLEDFRLEFQEFWTRLPNKAFFFSLLVCWFALFLFLGNSTLGYINSPSLFSWVLDAYHPNGLYLESDDGIGVLVPFVVLAILWWKRKQLLAEPLMTWWPALTIIAGGLTLHVLGYMVQQPRISLVGFFVGLYGIMGLAWGPRWLTNTIFPFVLFAFCVPMSVQLQPLTFYLRLWVCQLVEVICHYGLAIDILRDGTALRDPTGSYQYEVAAACSGMRSLTATFGLAFCFAFMSLTTWWKRLVILASALPLAMAGNLLRMMLIILAAEIGGQDWGNYVHDGGPGGFFSLVPYVPALFGLMYLEQWLRGAGKRKSSGPTAPGSGAPKDGKHPELERSEAATPAA